MRRLLAAIAFLSSAILAAAEPPVIAVTAPALHNGTYYTNVDGPVPVAGTVTGSEPIAAVTWTITLPHDGVELVRTGVASYGPATGGWSFTFVHFDDVAPLAAGSLPHPEPVEEFIIDVTAETVGGLTSTIRFGITVEIVPPGVSIASPTAGAVAYAAAGQPLHVAGEAYDEVDLAEVTWTIAGATVGSGAALVSDQSFSLSTVPIAVGESVVTVRAADRAGNAAEDALTVIGDALPPVLAIAGPATGGSIAVASGAPTITGTVTDDHQLVEPVRWTLTGATTASGVVDLGSVLAEPRTWHCAPPLRGGTSLLSIVAEDAAGHVTTRQIELVYAGAPTVAIAAPAGGVAAAAAGAALAVSGTAADPDGIASLAWQLRGATVGDGAAALAGDGRWSMATPALGAGTSTLAIIAFDGTGGSSVATLVIHARDPGGPAIAFAAGSAGSATVASGIAATIAGTAADPDGIASAAWHLGGAATGSGALAIAADGSWSLATPALPPGTSHLTITAIDGGGRMGSAALTLVAVPGGSGGGSGSGSGGSAPAANGGGGCGLGAAAAAIVLVAGMLRTRRR